MAILFHAVKRPFPGGQNGPAKFYAQAVYKDVIDLEVLTHRIEQIGTVSGGDIRAVLYDMVRVVSELLQDGHIVELGDVGRMRVSLRSEGADTQEELTAGKVKKAHILFRPGKKLQQMLKVLVFHKEAKAARESGEPTAE